MAKLSKEALAEIVGLFVQGIIKNRDVSDDLRNLDLVVSGEKLDELTLSPEYIASHPRETDWQEPT